MRNSSGTRRPIKSSTAALPWRVPQYGNSSTGPLIVHLYVVQERAGLSARGGVSLVKRLPNLRVSELLRSIPPIKHTRALKNSYR